MNRVHGFNGILLRNQDRDSDLGGGNHVDIDVLNVFVIDAVNSQERIISIVSLTVAVAIRYVVMH